MWKKNSAPSEMRVSVNDLSLGMYVSRLTRPREGDAEGFPGIFIHSSEDIDTLKAHSAYVYIDLSKSDKYAFLRLPENLNAAGIVALAHKDRHAAELAEYQGWVARAMRWFNGPAEGGFIYGEN